MKFKDKLKNFYNENKGLMMTAIILNLVFSVIVILSMCGLNIAAFSCENDFLIKMDKWLYQHELHMVISGLLFASNLYFMVAISSNDYSAKPLIYTICMLPVCVCIQYNLAVPVYVLSYLVPFCLSLAYSFKFSTMWKSALFLAIITLYQYLMMMTKLSIFGVSYLAADLLTYLLLSIDLFVVFIFYLCICKTIYKNKIKKEEK